MTLQFGAWLWQWYANQPKDIQEHFEQEIVGGDWLSRQPAKVQQEVLEGAPKDFVKTIIKELKPETAIAMGFNPFK